MKNNDYKNMPKTMLIIEMVGTLACIVTNTYTLVSRIKKKDN